MRYFTTCPSPVGVLTLASCGENLCGLWIEGQKHSGDTSEMREERDLPVFSAAKNWLEIYFSGGKPEISELPLAPAGGEFRSLVWRLLREIPYGKTVSYGDIAKKLSARCGGKRVSSRAVGGAVAHNPVSIIIPCHRVIGADGKLRGYAGGIQNKIKLLELEGVKIGALRKAS